jgi:hypothetical protein
MATVTPNFNWPVPTSTDLVKDGATAIEALGDSIDASLVDLKGGTTGQVLSKTSNTDMDFTWVAADDTNDIQNTIVDAKGDLIAATAADTPARLAVGADFGFLQADSAQSTGLAWNSGAWTTYTPTVTSGTGSYTTMSITGAYQRIGKTCLVRMYLQVDNKGTAAGVMNATLPFTSKNSRQSGTGADVNFTGRALSVFLDNSTTFAGIRLYDASDAWVNAGGYGIQITYEVA